MVVEVKEVEVVVPGELDVVEWVTEGEVVDRELHPEEVYKSVAEVIQIHTAGYAIFQFILSKNNCMLDVVTGWRTSHPELNKVSSLVQVLIF